MSGLYLIVFLTSLFAHDCTAPRPAPPELKALTDLAARHHVPMPPNDARLVLAHTECHYQLDIPSTGGDPGVYSPAFLLEEKPDGTAVVLRGTERCTISVRKWEPLWRKFSLDRVKGTRRGYATRFDDLATFVCAVQVAGRGDFDTVQALLNRFAEDHPDRLKNAPLLLAGCAYDYQWNQILQGPANWREVHVRMTALFDEFPELKTDERRDLLADLTTTLAARPPKAGSVEALLLDWAGRPHHGYYLGLFHEADGSDANAPALTIVFRGFEVVPDLIALLDDRRVTAHMQPGINNVPPSILRTGVLAACLLHEIAGNGTPSPPDDADPKAWRTWWEEARRGPEQNYFTSAVFLKNGKRITRVNESVAHVIARKWPEVLVGLCEQYTELAEPSDAPFGLADAVAVSCLPKDERVKVLTAFAGRGPLPHRRWVLQVLARLDAKKAAEILRPLLDKIPRDTRIKYGGCPEAYFAQVVIEIDDDAIWREYLRVAKRSSVGLQMEVMDQMTYTRLGTKNRARRLAFLSAFLADETVRDMSSDRIMFSSHCAASHFPRIAVRDFAAMEIASILGFDDDPDALWKSGQWAELRENVGAKLGTERLPDLGLNR
ncbi:MAG: hypothetical protein JWO38_2825 [Gemmataceae bacterium]|nr:hypothetical protein [Gemmataceae bacterium]